MGIMQLKGLPMRGRKNKSLSPKRLKLKNLYLKGQNKNKNETISLEYIKQRNISNQIYT
jgi:hypothetical protein